MAGILDHVKGGAIGSIAGAVAGLLLAIPTGGASLVFAGWGALAAEGCLVVFPNSLCI